MQTFAGPNAFPKGTDMLRAVCPHGLLLAAALMAIAGIPAPGEAACCYFSAKNADILQPAQKAFLTWDPVEKVETFTVQPKFEGNALDFGMVIPTPTQPKLHEMPRDFFKHLAIYSIMKHREFPHSKLLVRDFDGNGLFNLAALRQSKALDETVKLGAKRPTVVVLEAGVVGSLDYKIIEGSRTDALHHWRKQQEDK